MQFRECDPESRESSHARAYSLRHDGDDDDDDDPPLYDYTRARARLHILDHSICTHKHKHSAVYRTYTVLGLVSRCSACASCVCKTPHKLSVKKTHTIIARSQIRNERRCTPPSIRDPTDNVFDFGKCTVFVFVRGPTFTHSHTKYNNSTPHTHTLTHSRHTIAGANRTNVHAPHSKNTRAHAHFNVK